MGNTEEHDRIVTPYEGTGHRCWSREGEVPAPLHLHETPVSPRWVDYNGHMSESCFLLVFGDNADAFFRYVGIGEQYRHDGGSLYTVQTHLHNLREAAEGQPLALSLQVLDCDAKRLHVFHEMRDGTTGALLATAEQLLLHVDTSTGRTTPMPADLRERVETVRAAHAGLAVPEQVGRPLGIRHG
ncbi:thioesterase family protein [Bounagaea algeriensis]